MRFSGHMHDRAHVIVTIDQMHNVSYERKSGGRRHLAHHAKVQVRQIALRRGQQVACTCRLISIYSACCCIVLLRTPQVRQPRDILQELTASRPQIEYWVSMPAIDVSCCTAGSCCAIPAEQIHQG